MDTSLAPITYSKELSQWMTDPWLARMIANKVREHFWGTRCRILEPHAGTGNLVRALAEAGFELRDMTLNDIDPQMADLLAGAFGQGTCNGAFVYNACAKLLLSGYKPDAFDVAIANSPYENGEDSEHIAAMLRVSPVVYAVVRPQFEHFADAEKLVFSQATITWTAKCVGRPKFIGAGNEDGKQGGKFEVSVIRLDRGIVTHGRPYPVMVEKWFKPKAERKKKPKS